MVVDTARAVFPRGPCDSRGSGPTHAVVPPPESGVVRAQDPGGHGQRSRDRRLRRARDRDGGRRGPVGRPGRSEQAPCSQALLPLLSGTQKSLCEAALGLTGGVGSTASSAVQSVPRVVQSAPRVVTRSVPRVVQGAGAAVGGTVSRSAGGSSSSSIRSPSSGASGGSS